jgi:hypothetical protein
MYLQGRIRPEGLQNIVREIMKQKQRCLSIPIKVESDRWSFNTFPNKDPQVTLKEATASNAFYLIQLFTY